MMEQHVHVAGHVYDDPIIHLPPPPPPLTATTKTTVVIVERAIEDLSYVDHYQ